MDELSSDEADIIVVGDRFELKSTVSETSSDDCEFSLSEYAELFCNILGVGDPV